MLTYTLSSLINKNREGFMTSEKVHNIQTDRQLFVDDFLISELEGASRTLHSPLRSDVAIEGDKPWDLEPAVGSFIQDGDKFKAWYRSDHDSDLVHGRSGHDTLYAESLDGKIWEKPDLGLFEANGSTHNNIIWMGPGACMLPFKDTNPDAASDEQYKAIIRTSGNDEEFGVPRRSILAAGSPDGKSWHLLKKDPVMTDWPFDSPNLAFWDDHYGEYVAYTRGIAGTGTFHGGLRWIRRTTSKDFINWTELVPIETGEVPTEEFYSNACVKYERAPNTYLMFPSRFVHDRVPDPEWTYDTGVSDVVFMSSRDGLNFDRTFKEAFIRPGLDQNNWHDRGIYIERGILSVSPEEMALYGMENSHLPTQRIVRYSLRTDGFVSVTAGYDPGELITKPICFDGSELEINYSTSAVGSVKVEIQDENGNALPGFSMDDCPEKFGDEIDGVVSWSGDQNLKSLAGTTVRLRFEIKDADVYSYRFR